MDQTATNLWFGSMGTWLIILLLFMGNGNGFGFGGGFGGNNAAARMMANANNNNNHDNTVDIINNNTMWQNQLFANQTQANQTSLMQMGFCNTNNNIEKAILQSQQNTAQIMQNCTANTQKVLDMLCNQETQRLRAELAESRVIAQNNEQTATLIQSLRPYPVPAYTVTSPYGTSTTPTTGS